MKIRNKFTGEVILEVPGDTLTRADLRGADLTEADLTEADLRGADLTDATLTDATLTDATLTEAFVMLGGRKFFLTEEPTK